ncbi:MAG: DUF3570 domain-containing protein [Methylococcales bacterium]|nr:DUF3570 domain-containing protein [Methylococcales bacterium]
MAVTKKTSLLSRLSCAALALPGIISVAEAGRTDETYHTDFQYGYYSESEDRMQAHVYEAALSAPIAKSMSVQIGLVRDVLSGASPMFNVPDFDDKSDKPKPKQVLSGASIREKRDALSLMFNHYWDDVSVGIGGGISSEHDYLSRYLNTNLNWDFNKKLTTLSAGFSLAFDEIEPTGLSYQRNKLSQQYSIGITQVIDTASLINSNMTFSYDTGFLSDPYKSVFFRFSGIADDTRPKERFKWAWLNRYVRNFKNLNNAALHIDYRFYADSWDVQAHTFEVAWHQPVIDDWQIRTSMRFYTQSSAEFYQPYFDSKDDLNYYSSDYRLASFGVLSGGVKLSKEIKSLFSSTSSLKFDAGIEYFDRKASYSWSNDNNGNFDDFNYYLITASFKLRF